MRCSERHEQFVSRIVDTALAHSRGTLLSGDGRRLICTLFTSPGGGLQFSVNTTERHSLKEPRSARCQAIHPMLKETARPLSASERRLLQRRTTLPKTGSVAWMQDERRTAWVTVSICMTMIPLGALTCSAEVGAVLAGIFALLRFRSYRQRMQWRKHMLAHRQMLIEELESGQAYAITCQPSRIIEREEFEDEGALWIFDGGEGQYLAICGQEYRETARFPSAHFEVVMGSRHRLVIGIRSRGLRMPSTLVVGGDDIPWDRFPRKDITVFSAAPDAELPVILRSLAAARAT